MSLDRRNFVATLAAAACSGRLDALAPAAHRSGRPPNVLLVMSDEHRRTCMGAAGDTVARTPHLDRLCAEGVRFRSAYCTNPVCTPSRASIMTGLYSHHLEAQSNATPYRPEHRTLAHHFDAANYMTGLIGKMHWVDAQSHGFEYKLDFNDWFQHLGPKVQLYADELGQSNSGSGLPEIDDLWREEGDPWIGHRKLDDREGSVAVGRISLLDEEDHFDSFVARESVRFLHNFATHKNDRPFFLVSSFLKPHDPFMPAKRFADMFRPEDMKLPESWGKADKATLPREVQHWIEFNRPTPELRDPEEAKKRIALYYANLAQMDDCLGRILAALAEAGLAEDTIVCYTSDHGEMLGDLGLWQKFQFYEGSCGVPLIFRVSGVRPGDTPVSLVSLSATLTGLAGVPQLAPNDGASLAPWIHRPSTPRSYGPVFAEYDLGGAQPKFMVRDGEWKYTYWLHDIPELYHLRTDPQELHNLAALPQYAAQREAMHRTLLAWHRPDGSQRAAQTEPGGALFHAI
jgi:choline-sulfatase